MENRLPEVPQPVFSMKNPSFSSRFYHAVKGIAMKSGFY
jgi:hypothetical protein